MTELQARECLQSRLLTILVGNFCHDAIGWSGERMQGRMLGFYSTVTVLWPMGC